MTAILRTPSANRTIDINGGENLMRIAELYLGDATQWYRIWYLNAGAGEQPDFLLTPADAARLNGVLQIPLPDQNVTWP